MCPLCPFISCELLFKQIDMRILPAIHVCVFTFIFVDVNPFSLTPPSGYKQRQHPPSISMSDSFSVAYNIYVSTASPQMHVQLSSLHIKQCPAVAKYWLYKAHTLHSLCCCVTLATDQNCRREIIYICICWYMMTLES